MGSRQDGEGFGFAPPGEQGRSDAGQDPAKPVYREALGPAPVARALPAHQADGEKPFWLWLLIGILLGAGGTLLTSAFWLPERETRNLAASESGDEQRPSASVTAARASEPVMPPTSATPPIAAIATPVSVSDKSKAVVADQRKAMIQANVGDVAPTRQDRRPASARTGEALLAPVAPKLGGAGDRDTGSDPEPAGSAAAAALERLASKNSDLSLGDEGVGGPAADGPSDLDRRQLAALSPAANPPPDSGSTNSTPAPSSTERDASPAQTNAGLSSRSKQVAKPPIIVRPTTASDRSSSAERLYRVQLAAVNDENAARIYWREVNQRLPGVFTDVEPIFDERVVDQRLYLRIWVGAFEKRNEADGYCVWLKTQGQDCFVTLAEKR